MDKIKNNTLIKYGSLFAYLILYFLLFGVKKVISFGLISHITMIGIILLNFYYLFNKSFNKLKFKRSELPYLRPEDFNVFNHPDLSNKELTLKK